MNSRTFLAIAVLIVAAGLIFGMTFDLNTRALRHLGDKDIKKIIGICAVAVILLVALGRGFEGGPNPPRHP